jgi:thiaminase
MDQFFDRLNREEAACWNRILDNSEFVAHFRAHGVDRDLYISVLTEIFHYTRHNAQNQALAAIKLTSDRLPLLKYCLHHAYAEAGHDQMALRDLASIGVDPDTIKHSRPLPETEAFVAYLYRVAQERDATARLGYSYWAENAYAYIGEFVEAARRDLKLEPSQMSFFIEHSDIDVAHFEQVKKVIRQSALTPELQEGVSEILRTTLHLTGNLIEAAYRRYRDQRADAARPRDKAAPALASAPSA